MFHCEYGIGRSALLVCCVLVSRGAFACLRSSGSQERQGENLTQSGAAQGPAPVVH